MSRPANMAAQAATRSTTWAECAKVKAADGFIVAVTDHDRPLTVDLGDGDGAVVYTPEDGVELSTARLSADLSLDESEIVGIIESDRITEEDLHRGRYDEARVTRFSVDVRDPGAGQWVHYAGPVGKVSTHGQEYTAELLSWVSLLQRRISALITPQCRKSFGSLTAAGERKPNLPCGVNLDPPAWQASTAYSETKLGDRTVGDRVKPTTHNGWWFRCTVGGTSGASEPTWPTTLDATVVDNEVTWTAERALAWSGTVTNPINDRQLEASGIAVQAGFFAHGEIEWLTGDNAGRGRNSPVATDDGAGALVLYKPTLMPIQIADTFRILAGCDKSHARCIELKNWERINGLVYVPPSHIN